MITIAQAPEYVAGEDKNANFYDSDFTVENKKGRRSVLFISGIIN